MSDHVNAAPEPGRWGALCARLGVDPSASDEAVIAAARGRSAQPAPVRTERSRDVAPVVLSRLCGEQDTPTHSPWAEVRDLMLERIQFGIQRYKVPVFTHNGRSMVQDGREEGLDGQQYAVGAEMEASDEGAITAATWFADARQMFAHATLSMLRGERALMLHRERSRACAAAVAALPEVRDGG